MDVLTIVERDLTPSELERVRTGFDEHTVERGVELQSSERIGAVALDGPRFVGAVSALAYIHGGRYTGWCYVTDLFVEPIYRRRGVGSRLVRALEQALRQRHVGRIWTWTAAHEAPTFYTKLGYTVFAELEAWYSDGGSRFGVRKELTAPQH